MTMSIPTHCLDIGIETSTYLYPIHYGGFGGETLSYSSASNHSYLHFGCGLCTKHGTAYAFGAWEIHYLCKFVKVIELAFPVGSDGEDVYVVFLDVVDLLSYIVFDDDFVGIACCLDGFYPLEDVVAYVELSTATVEGVGGHAYDEVIA